MAKRKSAFDYMNDFLEKNNRQRQMDEIQHNEIGSYEKPDLFSQMDEMFKPKEQPKIDWSKELKPKFSTPKKKKEEKDFGYYVKHPLTYLKDASNEFGKLNKALPKPLSEVMRFRDRAGDSASFGLMGEAQKKLTGNEAYFRNQEGRTKGEKALDFASTGAGYLIPGVGEYKLLNASKVGKALTQYGEKSVGKRLASEAVKGATVGAGISVPEVAIKEGLNPQDQNWKDNAKYIGLNVGLGTVADPLLYGAGKGIVKGSESFAKNTIKKYSEQVGKNLGDSLKDVPKVAESIQNLPKGNIKEFPLQTGEFTKIKNNTKNQIKTNPESEWSDIAALLGEKSVKPRDPDLMSQDEIDWLLSEPSVKTEQSSIPIKDAPRDTAKEIDNAFKEMGSGMKQAMDENRQKILDQQGYLEYKNPAAADLMRKQFPEFREEIQVDGSSRFYPPKTKQPNESIQPMKLPKDVQAMQSETIPLRQSTGDKQFKEMGLLESVVNKVTKKYEKPITHQELLNSMKKNLGVTLRTGRMGKVGDEVKGYFKVNPEIIRTKVHGDVPVIAHEIGHSLDKRFNLANEAFDSELMKLGANTSGKEYTPQQVRQEGLAEYIRLFLTDPEKAIQEAPLFSQHFETVLPKKVKKGLFNVQSDVDRWIEQGPELQLRGKINRTGKEHETTGEKIDKIYGSFIDGLDRLKKVETAITGKINDASKSLYKKARLWVGAPKKAEMVLRDLKNTLKPIDKVGYTMKDVGDYVTAVHAKELETMGERVVKEAENEIADLSRELKITDDPIEQKVKILQDFERKYGIELTEKQIQTVANGESLELTPDQMYMINQANRIESGMTKEQIDSTIAKYEAIDQELVNSNRVKNGKFPTMQEIQQNIVAYNNKLLDMLQEGGLLTKEAVEAMREKYPNYVPFYRYFDDDLTVGLGGNKGFTNLTNPVKRLEGSTKNVIDPLESMVKNTFAVVNAVEKNKVGLELSRLADVEGAGPFIERLDGSGQVPKENIVTVWENGEKVQYQLDKDLYETIQRLDTDQSNKVIQFLSYPASMLRAGATLTPEFMLRNPIRDQFHAFVVSNYGYKPIIDLPLGVWEVVKGKGFNKDGAYKQWAMNGGGYGNYLSQDRNYLRETLHTLKKEGKLYQRGFKTITNPKELGALTLKVLRALSETTEEATKVGEFRRALKKGATVDEAAFQSRDLLDFGRVGSDMKQWNRAVAFLNANLQGKDKLARAFKNNKIRTTTRALTGVTLPAIGAYVSMEKLANEKQKETYANTPKWMKDAFFLVPIPGTDELARIPKPFDLAPMFANPVEQIMDYVKKNDPEGWDDFLKRQAVEILQVPHMLTGLAPVLENITNYSFFTGGPIVPRRDQELLPQDQYGVTTSLTARTAGKLTNTSPYKVDNLIRGYGAGLGKYATAGMDALLQKAGAGQLPPQEAKKWSELPVVNAFTVDSTGGGQIMTDFYDTLTRMKTENNSASRNNQDYERESDYKYINKESREISKLRNKYRDVQSSYDLSPAEKRKQLDELDRQMNQLARGALIQIGEKKK